MCIREGSNPWKRIWKFSYFCQNLPPFSGSMEKLRKQIYAFLIEFGHEIENKSIIICSICTYFFPYWNLPWIKDFVIIVFLIKKIILKTVYYSSHLKKNTKWNEMMTDDIVNINDIKAGRKELESWCLFVDGCQQGWGSWDPIKTVMKSEKDGNHKTLLRIRVSSLQPARLEISWIS